MAGEPQARTGKPATLRALGIIAGALAVARTRQRNIEGYAEKKLAPYVEKKKKKKENG